MASVMPYAYMADKIKDVTMYVGSCYFNNFYIVTIMWRIGLQTKCCNDFTTM